MSSKFYPLAVLAMVVSFCMFKSTDRAYAQSDQDLFDLNLKLEASQVLALKGGLKSASLSLNTIGNEKNSDDPLLKAFRDVTFVPHNVISNTPTWLQNAAYQTPYFDRPMIAIVIDDMGLNKKLSKAVSDLPGPLTLAYLPYADQLPEQTLSAVRQGHELMLHMPMEPHGHDHPGPHALLTGLEADEIKERVKHNLASIEGIVGVNNHMGSKFTESSELIDVVMQELKQQDMLFLDSKTSGRSIAEKRAGKFGIPTTHRDFFMDHEPTLTFAKNALKQAERHARKYGSSVVIGHPKKITIEALQEWLPYVEAQGFEIVPISKVVLYRNPKLQQEAAVAMAYNY